MGQWFTRFWFPQLPVETNCVESKTPKVKITSKDGFVFEVEREVAFVSLFIRHMFSETSEEETVDIVVPVVDGVILRKILIFCATHRGVEFKPKEPHEDQRTILTPADKEYLDVPDDFLLEMIQGANYLDIPGLIDIVTQKIANMADGKSVEELRQLFCLEDDFTPEEKEKIKEMFSWVET